MSFDEAQKKSEFWHAYYENQDERFYFKDPAITPQEFYEVWIYKDRIHELKDDPNRGGVRK